MLVRSANDSESDVALYNERTHGFLSKARTLRAPESPRSHLGVTSESSRRPSMPLAKLDESLRKKRRGHLGVPSAVLGLEAPSASPASIAA